MAQQTAWKKIVLVVAAAGVAMVLMLAAAAVAGFVWATSTVERLGEPTPEPVTRTIAVPGAAAEAVAGATGEPLRLDVDLQDGAFEVLPGPAGAGVRVEGTYARGYYELIEEHTPAGDPGGPAAVIHLRPTQSFWVRLAAQAVDGHRGAPNSLTVTIPQQVPIALTLRLSTGESRTDLGGLHLTDLQAELSMGEHRLDFSRPLAGRPSRVRVDGGMGEVRLERLGNAGPRDLEVSGRMGSLTIDLHGDWPRDAVADLTVSNTMSELRLVVPDTVRIAPDANAAAILGETDRIRTRTADGANGGAPLLRLHLSNTMGETRVRRY